MVVWARGPEEPIDKDRNAQGYHNHDFSWSDSHLAASAIGAGPLPTTIRWSTLNLGMSEHHRFQGIARRKFALRPVRQVARTRSAEATARCLKLA